MARLRCFRCGARIQVDGTSACTCTPFASREIEPANFEPFRPRLNELTPGSSADEADGPPLDGTGRARLSRRGKSVIVGVAAAVTIGTVAFALDGTSSGPASADRGRPAVSVSPDPDVVAREVAQNAQQDAPEDPGTVTPSKPADDNGMWPMSEGKGKGEQPGSQSPAPSDEAPSPSPSGDASGGTADGGTADGGTSAGGGTGDPGGDDGGSGDDGGDQHGGGLLGGLLFGGLFGGGDGDDDHHDDGGHANGGYYDDGRDHHHDGRGHGGYGGYGGGHGHGGYGHGGGHGRF
jgi:hypothetical protein